MHTKVKLYPCIVEAIFTVSVITSLDSGNYFTIQIYIFFEETNRHVILLGAAHIIVSSNDWFYPFLNFYRFRPEKIVDTLDDFVGDQGANFQHRLRIRQE